MNESTMKLILQGHRYLPNYEQGMSSHLPMALYALSELGAKPKRIQTFYDFYIIRLTENTFVAEEIRTATWKTHLGNEESFTSLVGFFKAEINKWGIIEVLEGYVPELLPGVSGGAFHPLIRLAYALEIDNEVELAHALASWVCDYQELNSATIQNGTIDFEKGLLRLKTDLLKVGFKAEAVGIFRRMKLIAEGDVFSSFLEETNLKPMDLDTLADYSIRLYLAGDDNFTALHAVTSCHAMRILFETINTKFKLTDYISAWCTAYVDAGMPEFTKVEFESLPSWDLIKAEACETNNDHAFKFVYTCMQEYEYYRKPIYHYAAAKKVGLV